MLIYTHLQVTCFVQPPVVVVVAGAAIDAAAAAASAIAVYVEGQQHPDLPASPRSASAISGKPKQNVNFLRNPLEVARVLFKYTVCRAKQLKQS